MPTSVRLQAMFTALAAANKSRSLKMTACRSTCARHADPALVQHHDMGRLSNLDAARGCARKSASHVKRAA